MGVQVTCPAINRRSIVARGGGTAVGGDGVSSKAINANEAAVRACV